MKLYRRVPCGYCEAYIDEGRGIGCLNCNYTGYVYRPVELLAEFEGSVYKKDLIDVQPGGQQTLQIVGDKMNLTNYKEVTVLILEKGGKNEAV